MSFAVNSNFYFQNAVPKDRTTDATARAAKKAGVGMILSTMSTKSIEEVAAVDDNPHNAPQWFQLYIHKGIEGAIRSQLGRGIELYQWVGWNFHMGID